MTLLDCGHLLRVIVVVRERVIHVRNVETVTVCDRFRAQTPLMDPVVDVPNSDPGSVDMRFLVDLLDDTRGLLRHL
jgi:hypothetical protein